MGGWKQNSLGGWYRDDEYRSPNAGTVYKAPKKKKTEGEKLEESGEYLKDPETEVDTSKPLESRMFDIDPKKHKAQQKQGKIRNIAEQGATPGEQAAGQRKLKDKTILPNLSQVTDPQAEELAEYDRLMEEARNLPAGQERIDKIKEAHEKRPDHGAGALSILSGSKGHELINDISSHFAEFKLDSMMFKKGSSIMPSYPHWSSPVLKVAGGGTAVLGRRVLKQHMNDILNFNRLQRLFRWRDQAELVTPDGMRIKAYGDEVDNINPSKPLQMTGSGGNLKKQVLEEKLKDPRIEKFLTGEGTLRNKELSNLIQDISDRDDFMSVVSSRIDQLKEKYPHLVRKLDNQKETIALRWHHVNPSKGPIDLYIGLTDKADRAILRDSLVNELGVFSGNHPLNNRGLSIDVHDQIHDWLGTRIGLRADVLKHKWAQKIGIDVGDLQPGTGFMENHLTLSKEGKAAFDSWFKTLKPHERLPYIKEYGKIIKESEEILGDLMRQYDALFAVPEGYHLHPDNDVLLRFLEEIPTDGSKLLQKDMRRIVEQVNKEMPRGTLDIRDGLERSLLLNLESPDYKRIQELKQLLDQKGLSRRTINSYKKELAGLEKGLVQKTLDIEGATKSGITKKRLEQERLRREGK